MKMSRQNVPHDQKMFSFKLAEYDEMIKAPCPATETAVCEECGRTGATYRLSNKCLCVECYFAAKHKGTGHDVYTNAQGLIVCDCYEPRK
jgi:protein-arginine kinase activator protein McsA